MQHGFFLDYSIQQTLQAYRDKLLDPVYVAESIIRFVQSTDTILHAWEHFDAEYFLQQARLARENIQRRQLRAFEGIPVGIKDIMNTTRFQTQMGSALWQGFFPGNDARVVYHVERAGGIMPGKTSSAEFGVHALSKTNNPHHAAFSPGTSSSGSAVAVATGMLPVALGTQTAGSIVRPASFCGVYGVKPSFGLIPRTGILKTADTLDSVGFFVSHAHDLASVLNALRVSGKDYPFIDAALDNYHVPEAPRSKPWRVGFVRTHTWNYAYDYAQEAMINWIQKLAAGHGVEVEELKLSEQLSNAHDVHRIIYNRSLAYYFQEEFKQRELVSDRMAELIEDGLTITPQDYQQALAQQCEMVKLVDSVFEEYDVLISLSTAGQAPLRDEIELPDPALMWTMTYVPVVSAPVFTAPSGLPFGIQLFARRYQDLYLFTFIDHLVSLGLLPASTNPTLKNAIKNKADYSEVSL
ncbi:amidase [Candidatus Babeliales bacterium]|nr:amidase [Candidatus Babeliales bacterium]